MFHISSRLPLVVLSLIVAAGLVACAPPVEPEATPSPAVQPSPTPLAESPLPTSPIPTPPPETPSPTATPEPTAERVIALYAAGSPERATLQALTADGSIETLDQAVYEWSAVSDDGRWFATSSSESPAGSVVVVNLQTGTTYTVPVRSGFDVYGMAFDYGAPRLAFLELGLPDADPFLWAMVIVDLDEGSTVRLEGPDDAGNGPLPGNPLGWSGTELLLGTFVPYTGETSAGVWSMTVPLDVPPAPVEELDLREVLSGGSYLFQPELSPEATRLLYLNRDYDYTPDDYDDFGLDLAVNQLWMLHLANESPALLVDETEGAALGWDIAWSPDGALGMFALGRYAGRVFESLTLKTVDATGAVTIVAPIPLPPGGELISLDWCAPDTALVVVTTADRVHELHWMDLNSGESSLIVSDDEISVLGCVDAADAGRAP